MHHLLDLQKNKSAGPAPRPERGHGRLVLLACAALAALVLVWVFFGPRPWRAVFLTNDQVYFGKFRYYPFIGTVSLRDVHYLQMNQSIQPADAEAGQEVKVIRLGNELHGPENKMIIPKSQILFFEDLRSDSAVVKTIQESERTSP